ncbi:hypothetical protein EVAR_91495_1 [Eumeta japonica]|uniref:Uncharacterized protein n=1 Tax=Eumeta variegata TaxID=151549 RepID=A0A4C1VDC1_EUMVA|nr:hypothetical protein EVAR_91495_1 [Eumeta japonica]
MEIGLEASTIQIEREWWGAESRVATGIKIVIECGIRIRIKKVTGIGIRGTGIGIESKIGYKDEGTCTVATRT